MIFQALLQMAISAFVHEGTADFDADHDVTLLPANNWCVEVGHGSSYASAPAGSMYVREMKALMPSMA